MPIAEPSAVLPDGSADLLSRFESVGGVPGAGDEFHQVQREAGLPHSGLLSRAEMPETTLAHLLETGLDGVGGAGNVLVGPWPHSDEWWTRDPRFPLAIRSGLRVAERPLLGLTALIRRRWQYLRARLLDRLARGDAVLVFRGGGTETLPALDAALGRYPGTRLLYVRSPDADLAAGMVRPWSERILVAALPCPMVGAGPDAAGWLALCRSVLDLITRGTAATAVVPATPVSGGGIGQSVAETTGTRRMTDVAPPKPERAPQPKWAPEQAPEQASEPEPEPTDAEGGLRAAVARSPGSVGSHDALARFLMERNRASEAFAVWTAALDLAPTDLARMTHLGGLLLKAERFADAAAVFKRAAALAPHSIGVATQHLAALQRAGDFPAALAVARRVVVLDPDNPRRFLQLSGALAAVGDLETAEDVTRLAIAMDPTSPDGHLALSGLRAERSQLDEALAAAKQAVDLQADNTRALGQVGRLAMRLGRFEEAEAALTRAASLEPAAATWKRLLADVRQRRSRPQPA